MERTGKVNYSNLKGACLLKIILYIFSKITLCVFSKITLSTLGKITLYIFSKIILYIFSKMTLCIFIYVDRWNDQQNHASQCCNLFRDKANAFRL